MTRMLDALGACGVRERQRDLSTVAWWCRMEDGDLKLRVRVLESERAARRQAVLQKTQLHTIALFGFLNLGSTFALQSQAGPANLCLALSLAFGGLVTQGMRRVQRLDKFEKDING